MTKRAGVTDAVDVKMTAVQADVLFEDGMLFRTCEHGIRHPVGHVDSDRGVTMADRQRRHHRAGEPFPTIGPASCDQCCLNW